MKTASLTQDLAYSDNKPVIQVLFESESTKEIRIALKKGQVMKEHKTPFPIVVELFSGQMDFGVNGSVHHLSSGSLIALEGNLLHDLTAIEDSVVRLSLSLNDKIERVEKIETTFVSG